MPRFNDDENGEIINVPGPGNFQYSAVRIEDLGATQYTLVTIICDRSGSVEPFADELLQCIKTIVAACKKSPRSEFLMLRLLLFNDDTYEVHGFKLLHEIDVDAYEPLSPGYTTLLFDSTYDGVCATLEYSERLLAKDFDCNGAIYIITDGMDTHSKTSPSAIKAKIIEAVRAETIIESLITVLIGLQDPNLPWTADTKKSLERFKDEAGLSEFLDVGDATAQKLAKLANWVSESVSSQSQGLEDESGPSQILAF